MIKEKVVVPRGIRFMSEWTDFGLPDYPCILDKQIPGCGFTEYCICNRENIVLCSPRKLLLENKEDQHQGEVFYVRFELDQDETTDKNLEGSLNRGSGRVPTKAYDLLTPDEIKKILEDLEKNLTGYVNQCITFAKPAKILVTYDSFRLVKEILEKLGVLHTFRIIIDEFQSIFTDSRFKASSELEFVNHLQSLQKVCFVSATPMIDEYLEQIDEFKMLPYYELDWVTSDPLRVLKPELKALVCKSVCTSAISIIDTYLNGNFESALDIYGKFVQSKEAVFYVNSVTNILGIIKKVKLKPEQCNILIARTPDNIRKLKRKLGRKWEIGSIPKKGEPHKMFTFCTRTVYLGADFYSTNARTFIFSDANIETLSVDISLDLPQILGRQRNIDNPWRNSAIFYYRTNYIDIKREVFDKKLQEKMTRTEKLLENYDAAPNKYYAAESLFRDTNATNYKYHYVAINRHAGNTLIPTLNKLVRIAEQRSFDIQQLDYKDRFSVFNSLYKSGVVENSERAKVLEIIKQVDCIQNNGMKLKHICNLVEGNKISKSELSFVLDQIPRKCKEYYLILGAARCRALGFNITYMNREIDNFKNNTESKAAEAIQSTFQVGEVYLLKDIKAALKGIYDSLGYNNKNPKAIDLKNYFKVERACKGRKEALRIIDKI